MKSITDIFIRHPVLAMVLAVGLVVENIQRHVQEGKTRTQAALIGARALVGPIIAMTIGPRNCLRP